MSNQEKTTRKTQDMLERLPLSAGQGAPQYSLRRCGGGLVLSFNTKMDKQKVVDMDETGVLKQENIQDMQDSSPQVLELDTCAPDVQLL